jgi:hypothetical protein
MSLLAEEIVEEWLNRRGYFTIRGVREGVHEIDLLAIRPVAGGGLECRHVEVQASARPISHVASLSVADPQGGIRKVSTTKRRTPEQMSSAVRAWVDKKFRSPSRLLESRLPFSLDGFQEQCASTEGRTRGQNERFCAPCMSSTQ